MTEAQQELARRGRDDPASLTNEEIQELGLIVLEQLGYGWQAELGPENVN